MFLMHAIVYFKYNFSFSHIDKGAVKAFKLVLKKFLPSLIGVSIVEINLFIDVILASFLPEGSVSLIYYSGRFVNMPVGIFAVGFATVLLPQFSRFATYAPKRLNFYIFESTKFISFLIIPAMLFLMFISENFFKFILLGKRATPHNVFMTKWLLIIYAAGLLFLCLNKVLVNAFYSLHDTITPTKALGISTVINFSCNVVGMLLWGAFGIVASTTISAISLTFLLFFFLKKKHNFNFYSGRYFSFLGRYLVLVLIATLIFLISYFAFFKYLVGPSWYIFFSEGLGYWMLVGAILSVSSAFIWFMRKRFGLKLYFLSK